VKSEEYDLAGWKSTDVSTKRIASFFMVEDQAMQPELCLPLAYFCVLLTLLLDPEDGGDTLKLYGVTTQMVVLFIIKARGTSKPASSWFFLAQSPLL
jgi:hypothetical protein